MELSILVAKLFGAVYAALGLGMLFNMGYYKKAFAEMMKNTTYILLGGIAALVIGMLIVMNHNIWEASWVVIITIIGWLALVKGVLLLVIPKFVNIFEGWFKNKSFLTVTGVGALILGLVLLYFGFYM